VHGWDVARALGAGYDLEPGLLGAALAIARAVPDGENRRRPGAAFAPRVAVTGGSPLNQIVALLGRRPAWPRLSRTPDGRPRPGRGRSSSTAARPPCTTGCVPGGTATCRARSRSASTARARSRPAARSESREPYQVAVNRQQAAVRRPQLPAACAASFCSTSSPSIAIWISSPTTSRPSSTMLKDRPKSLRLILVVAP
jgi:hypothetical protein